MPSFQAIFRLLYLCKALLNEAPQFLQLTTQSRASLSAEVLFLRKQLAFYQEREIKRCRVDDAARRSMLLLSKLLDWRKALINVNPETFTGWHKKSIADVVALEVHVVEGHDCQETYSNSLRRW